MKFHTILTHPGGAHKDEFLACCLLIAESGAPVVRREPVAADLDNPLVAVVDVGHRHDPVMGNFDHHQFPADHPPCCALSLVLEHLGVYQDARNFCDWLEPAEWFDTRGPNETARWLGVERKTLVKLNSPIDTTLLRRFAGANRWEPGDVVWEMMRMIGEDLIGYLRSLRQRLDFIAAHSEVWDLGKFKVLYLPRTEPLPDEPSAGMERFIRAEGLAVAGMIYPDRRGPGYGLSRYEDCPRLDFCRIENEPDVGFAHARGFVAKTRAADPARLRELVEMAWIG